MGKAVPLAALPRHPAREIGFRLVADEQLNPALVNKAIRSSRSWQEAAAVGCVSCQLGTPLNKFCSSTLITSFAKGSEWLRALGHLRLMPRLRMSPDGFCYAAALNACQRRDKWKLVGGLTAAMRDQRLQSNVIIHTCNLRALRARAGASRWSAAVGTFQDLGAVNLEADVILWSSLISSLSWRRVLDTLSAMQLASSAGDKICYNSAVAASAWQWAAHLSCSLASRWHVLPDLTTFTYAMSSSQSWRRTLRLAEAARHVAVEPDAFCCTAAISGAGAERSWRSALSALEGVQPDAVCWSGAIAAGSWKEALIVAGQAAVQDLLGPSGRNALLSALGRGTRWRQVIDKAAVLTGVRLDNIGFNSVMASQSRWQKALDAMSGQIQQTCLPDIIGYNALVTSCAQSATWSSAYDVFRRVFTCALRPDVVTHAACMGACAENSWRATVNHLQQLRQQGIRSNQVAAAAVLSAMEIHSSWRTALGALGANVEREAWNTVLSGCAKSSWHSALTVLDRMIVVGTSPDSISYFTALGGCPSWRWESALRRFLELVEAHVPDVVTCGSMLRFLEVGADCFSEIQILHDIDECAVQGLKKVREVG
ncbi:unnamed protein product [Effrenium voratum]|uniref:Pentatricopeptide repeat-containing protein, chloroplastic n=1 Tax=Effrenium voratum TaxID=2562239 RepID=A0AA36N6G4_9DINO|nr:unnamed protein product [Effrenium voratum]CAJ1425745.1 unnamed protein product [Effrenium voratum]CAJ1441503.1 unnamed protein product [Effrenium voratum]